MSSSSIQERLVAGSKGYRKQEISQYTCAISCSMQLLRGVGGSHIEAR